MKTYKIANWGETYENADTRKRKSLFWVLVPNAHDGLGFCSIMEREDGPAIFGAWVLILQVASKCSNRGSLTSSKGRPYTARDIATITRAPVESIQDALNVLVEIGWVVADSSADHPDKVADHPDVSADVGLSVVTKKERKRMKESRPQTPTGGDEGGESGIAIPSPHSDDKVFMSAWNQWERYQQQSGNRRWGPVMRYAHLEHLATMSPEDAATSLCDAMMKGWQGPAKVIHQQSNSAKDSKPVRAVADPKTADDAIKAMKEASA